MDNSLLTYYYFYDKIEYNVNKSLIFIKNGGIMQVVYFLVGLVFIAFLFTISAFINSKGLYLTLRGAKKELKKRQKDSIGRLSIMTNGRFYKVVVKADILFDKQKYRGWHFASFT